MKRVSVVLLIFAVSLTSWAVCPDAVSAIELGWVNLAGLVHSTPVDIIRPPHSCDQCKKEFCVERVPVTECKTGKKLVYDTKKRYEYVTIPETRYRYVTRRVTKEVKCSYCMPTCETTDVDHCYEKERWDTEDSCSGELHCKTCETKVEKLPCKHCGRRPGETIVKVRVRECVKEPYIVYRRVQKQVCIKQPRYERVQVSVTRYVCNTCGGNDCQGCCDQGGCEPGCEYDVAPDPADALETEEPEPAPEP